jgi:hypothetical protein
MAKMHVVTGKLGGGKTLWTVKKAKDYLHFGRPVATNLDINLSQLLGKRAKCNNLIRLPDHPTAESLSTLGFAYKGPYDENKSGALILDECATWLNGRDWNAKGRKELIEVLVHIRKMGWDCYFIIQDVSMLDKQLRKILAEHVVIVRRLDRTNIPIISWLGRLAGQDSIMPKAHVASVFYGDGQGSPLVQLDTFRGQPYYRAYETRQIFNADFDNSYCLLSPEYINRTSKTKWDIKKIMRFSKIYWGQFSRPAIAVCFSVSASFLTSYLLSGDIEALNQKIEGLEVTLDTTEKFLDTEKTGYIDPDSTDKAESEPKKSLGDNWRITGRMSFGDVTIYSLVSRDESKRELQSDSLASLGYKIKDRGDCEALAVNRSTGSVERITCI